MPLQRSALWRAKQILSGDFTDPDYIGHDFATLTRAGNLWHYLASAYSLITHCNNLFFQQHPLGRTMMIFYRGVTARFTAAKAEKADAAKKAQQKGEW